MRLTDTVAQARDLVQ